VHRSPPLQRAPPWCAACSSSPGPQSAPPKASPILRRRQCSRVGHVRRAACNGVGWEPSPPNKQTRTVVVQQPLHALNAGRQAVWILL
jgi:hypothetical protein